MIPLFELSNSEREQIFSISCGVGWHAVRFDDDHNDCSLDESGGWEVRLLKVHIFTSM